LEEVLQFLVTDSLVSICIDSPYESAKLTLLEEEIVLSEKPIKIYCVNSSFVSSINASKDT